MVTFTEAMQALATKLLGNAVFGQAATLSLVTKGVYTVADGSVTQDATTVTTQASPPLDLQETFGPDVVSTDASAVAFIPGAGLTIEPRAGMQLVYTVGSASRWLVTSVTAYRTAEGVPAYALFLQANNG